MFKYLLREHAYALTRMGCLRVGTLYDFRKNEHRSGIHDPQEGKKKVIHSTPELKIEHTNRATAHQSKHLRALSTFGAISLENCSFVTISPQNLVQELESQNLFIYCLSSLSTPDLYREFEGSNVRVHIHDVRAFFNLVTQSLNSIIAVRFRGFQEVRYASRQEHWNGTDWGGHPALLKEVSYSGQHEYRAIWQPIGNSTILPLIIGNVGLPACCHFIGY